MYKIHILAQNMKLFEKEKSLHYNIVFWDYIMGPFYTWNSVLVINYLFIYWTELWRYRNVALVRGDKHIFR